MRYFVILAVFVLSTTTASGKTVHLDFQKGFTQQADNSGLGGTWSSGFGLSATTLEFIPLGQRANISRINDSNTGYTFNVNTLSISRPDGKLFSLKSLKIPLFGSNVASVWEGIDKATGQWVSSRAWAFSDIVSLIGTKIDGSTVSQKFTPTNNSTVLTSPDYWSHGFWSNPNSVFKTTGLDDLVSIQLSASFDFSMNTLCRADNLARVDQRFAQSGFCSGTIDPNGSLTNVIGFLETGGRNDLSYFDLGGLKVEVSAVPLPAGVLLLLTALVGLGLLRGFRNPKLPLGLK